MNNGGGGGGVNIGSMSSMGSMMKQEAGGWNNVGGGIGGMMNRGGSVGGGGSASGMSDNWGITRRSDAILVRNLAPDYTWQMLKDRFAHVGDIKYAEMKERGTGVIRFGSERDSDRAVSMMNGQRFEGRNITVSFY